jgi:hypothetical protein
MHTVFGSKEFCARSGATPGFVQPRRMALRKAHKQSGRCRFIVACSKRTTLKFGRTLSPLVAPVAASMEWVEPVLVG